jgi:hypothetical protein
MQPPRRINDKLQDIDINNYVFAWHNEQPVIITIIGSSTPCIPIFAEVEKLHKMLSGVVEYTSIKQIDDMHEFIASVPPRINIIYDLHKTNQGRLRYNLLRTGIN